jgi:hypothetical protein
MPKSKEEIHAERLRNLEKARAARGKKKVNNEPVVVVENISIPVRKGRIRKLGKTEAEKKHISAVRSEAGKKGAAVRWAKYRSMHKKNNERFEPISKSLTELEPLKLEYSKFEPLEEVKPMKKEKHIETERLPGDDEVMMRFFALNVELTKEIADCLAALKDKTVSKDSFRECLKIGAISSKHLSDAFENFPIKALMSNNVTKKNKELALKSIDTLSKYIYLLTDLIVNKINRV